MKRRNDMFKRRLRLLIGSLAVTSMLGATVVIVAPSQASAATTTPAVTAGTSWIAAPLHLSTSSGGAAPAVTPGCVVHIDDAHISTSTPTHVKVTAYIQCTLTVVTMNIYVTLWKTGFFVTYLQDSTHKTKASGTRLTDKTTKKKCTNRTQYSTFYGKAVGSVVYAGRVYTNSVRSPHNANLLCGTS